MIDIGVYSLDTALDIMGQPRPITVSAVTSNVIGKTHTPPLGAWRWDPAKLDVEEFGQIVVKTGDRGQVTRLDDIGRVELGAKNSDVNSYLDGEPAITLAVFQLPGSNALATAESVRAEMERIKATFPDGVDYRIVYDTTVFVEESIASVYHTLLEAFVLVFIVVLVFLQN